MPKEKDLPRVDTLCSANSPIATTAGENEVAPALVVPASPLPWRLVRGRTDGSLNVYASDDAFVCLVGRERKVIDEAMRADVHYLVRSANAFPQLVEALTALVAHTTNGACKADPQLAAAYSAAITALRIAEGTGV